MPQVGTKEHYDLIAHFEKLFSHAGRLDKEERKYWARGHVYQHGEVNELFRAFSKGHAYGQAQARLEATGEAQDGLPPSANPVKVCTDAENVRRAVAEAVTAVYLGDNHCYRPSLMEVIKELCPDAYQLIEDGESGQAYEMMQQKEQP